MKVCLSHMTAFKWYMRNPRVRGKVLSVRSMANLSLDTPSIMDAKYLQRFLREGLAEASNSGKNDGSPTDLLVTKHSSQYSRFGLCLHLTQEMTPAGSYRHIEHLGSTDLLIVSPELLFIQLCCLLPFDEAVYCGMALCSNYMLSPKTEEGITLRNTCGGPHTSVASISEYLRRCAGQRGTKKASRALPFILDNSYSPMESGIAMTYRLPTKWGGFGYADVALNQEIKIRLPSNGVSRGKTAARKPDILVRAVGSDRRCRMVGIDYESALVHTRAQNLYSDSVRRNEIAMSHDLAYFTLTKEQALEFGAFCDLAEKVRVSLKVRKKPDLRVPETSAEARRIREEVAHRRFQLWAKVVCPSNFRKIG